MDTYRQEHTFLKASLKNGSELLHNTFLSDINDIYFRINLVRQLGTLACQSGVYRSKDIRKQVIWLDMVSSLHDHLRC